MQSSRLYIISLLALGLSLLTGCKDSSTVTDKHISASLIADQDTVSPGASFTLGVKFDLEPGWHIYWKNPGDSGLPPRFNWSSNDSSVSIKAPLWPHPERIATGPLVNYGYNDTLIPFPATVSSSTKSDQAEVTLDLEWLVCKDECLPGEGRLKITLPIKNEAGFPSNNSKLFEQAYEKVPAPLERVSIAIEEEQDHVTVALIPLDRRALPSDLIFFPEDRRVISNSREQRISRDGDALRITLARDPGNRESIARIRGVLLSKIGWSETGQPKAVAIDTNPGDDSPTDNYLRDTATSFDSQEHTGIVAALIFAFIGGIILNLMPCVFPVLSIKIISFLEHSNHDTRVTRNHGLFFTAGVVVSFWILAGIIASVRAGGDLLGWGFQLQSPTFVAIMIIVFLSLGLLLLTEVTIGQGLQRIVGKWRVSTSYVGSFASGALATAVATPCTAPFMSTALAATLTLPASLSFLVFTSLALGMSAPYLLLSWRPELLRFLPRPGVWMESFKQLMAFPLFASVVWLTRVFARQMGFEPPGLSIVTDLLCGLLAISFAFWLLARAPKFSSTKNALIARIIAVISILWGTWAAIPSAEEVAESRSRACAPSGDIISFTDSHGLLWESYSEVRLSKVLAQGRPVFLDFTAEWCITCQVNERVVFSSSQVRELIAQKNITLMRGDWTSKNPAITAALKRFGRNGVPLNVLLTSPDSEPTVLPNILTPGIVIEALNRN
jgi:thiol:disulfide interchange protein/DsbC/DsbD-like thiol-disulfide interchange protein